MNLTRPSPTPRGQVVGAVAVFAFVMGHLFGGRALNAVFMPAVAFLVVGALQTARAPLPTVTRHCPEHGHVGDTVSVRLSVSGDRSVWTRVVDDLGSGIRGDSRFDLIADERTLRYEATLRTRGDHQIGPLTVTVRDFFGLWARTDEVATTDRIVVFPRIRPLHESAGLLSGYVGVTDVREQFDTIREYEPGDALRDVNWKASAKRPEQLVVTEYAGEGAHNRVMIGVSAPGGRRDDAVAEAAASVAMYLLNNGLAVGIVTPNTHLTPGRGDRHRRQVLTALARFDGDRGDSRDFAVEPDITIHAPRDGRHVAIAADEITHRFTEVLAGQQGAAG